MTNAASDRRVILERIMRLSLSNLLLALLPIAVMSWAISDVLRHEFNRWTMLRTVCLVVFSVPAMIGALLGGSVGFRLGSQIGFGFALMGMLIGMVVIRIILV
jgi:hypothetical protein